jgi:2'-5' RNA ligase
MPDNCAVVRLFAAVEVPAAERERLAVAVGGLKSLPLRLTPEEHWHITVGFYGEVPEGVVGDLTERLRRGAARTGPFQLQLARAGTFPRNAAKARVLWIGLDGETAELSRLAERCVAAGRRCGLAMEDRKFSPHLTIGRSRQAPADLERAVRALWDYQSQPWQVTSIKLIRSTLGATVRHDLQAELTLEH